MTTISGIPVDPITGEPKDERGLLALQKQEEEEQEESGFDPMRMAALQAGASLLRHSGPRYTPMSFGQAIGHAIPAGIQGYYQQDALNQQEQQAMLERQQAEQQALQDKQQAEEEERLQKQDQESFSLMMNELGLSVPEQRTMLRFYMQSPKEASAYLAKRLMDKKEDKGKTRMVTPEEREEWNLQENQMYQIKPDGTLIVVPSAKEDPTWKTLTKAEKIKEGITGKYLDLVWQKNSSGQLQRKSEIQKETKKNTFRENVVEEQKDGTFQMRTILFDETGERIKDLGPSELEEAPPEAATFRYLNNEQFSADPNLQNLNWPAEAKAAAVNEKGELQGFTTEDNKFIPFGTKGIELGMAQERLDIAQNTLELKEDQFQQQQDNYQADKTREMLQQAKENKWTSEKITREKFLHEAKLAQMAKNYEDRTKYISAEEFLEDNETARLPEGVAFLEIEDGKITKMVEKDFSTWVEPLSRESDEEIGKELKKLYEEHDFTDKQKSIIRGLRLDEDDPMAALKKAHDFLQKEGKLIQAPASILKKYQSDMGVARAAEEALAMINNPEEWAKIEKEVGFFYGQVTEKAKHPVFQKFKAIATMANLTKRHELIGSQMTDGELKFTEPLFVSDKDTADSLRVKLNTLLDDAKYNISLTRGMFSKEAGYNDAVWNYDPSKFWSPVDNQGNTTATSVEDIIKEAGEARGGQGPGTSGAESEPFDENTIEGG